MRTNRFFRLLFFTVLAFSFWQDTYAQTRVGNWFTLEEKAFWRIRAGLDAGTKQYAQKGDVQTNSPGDWDRIVANKNAWLANPAIDRYTTYFRGCSTCAFPKADDKTNSDPYETDDAYLMMHAAFWAFLTNDAGVKTLIRNEIMTWVVNATYTSTSGETGIKAFDFYNTRRWASRTFGDIGPGFGIAEWQERLLWCFQLTSAQGTAWSDSDKAAFNTMVRGSGYFFKTNYEFDADGLFVDRSKDNYALSRDALSHENSAADAASAIMYTDATGAQFRSRFVSRNYSNRRATIAAWVGHAGYHLGDQPLIESSVKYFKELITYGIYPNGVYCDFLRQVPTNPQKGFAYAANGQMLLLAEAGARAGDTRLYDFETIGGTTATVAGTLPSSDGVTKKSIRQFLKAMCRLWRQLSPQVGAPLIYGTDSPSLATGVDKNKYLIDGTNDLNGDRAIWFAYMVWANNYYQDSEIEATILQTASGSQGYPSTPQKAGSRDGWTGGIMPAWMLTGAKRQAGSGAPNQYPGKISLTPQTISFTAIPDKTYGDGSFTLTATAPGGTVVFSSSDVTKATVSGNTVTIKGAGSVAIYANQGGSSTYFPAPQTSQSFTIAQKALTFTVSNATRAYNKANPTFSGSYVGFVGSETATVLTTPPTIITTATQSSSPGTYAISASNGSALNYALSYVPATLTITKGTVSFNVTANLNRLTSDGPWTFSTTLYEEGTTNVITGVALVYSKISGTSVTSINSSTGLVTLSGTAGNSVIQVANAANPYYFQWNTQRQVTVAASSKTTQSITFNALPSVTYGASVGTLSATATSALAVTFESSDPTIASISGTSITYLKAGSVNIIAHQLGNSSFEIAPDVIRQLVINKKSLTVTADAKTRVFGAQNPAFTYVITGYIGGENAGNLTSLPVATTAATTTSSAGAYAIVPSGGSADNYSFTYVNGQLSITQAPQVITFPTISDHGVTEVPFQLNATSSSGLAVTYSIVSGPATVSTAGLVTLAGTAGTVVVRASQVGNSNYSAASTVDRSFATINPSPTQNQLITVVDPGVKVYSPGSTFTLSTSANSQLPVTTTVVSGPGTILSNVVTITGAGTIVLKSVQAGNSDYFPAPEVFTNIVVNKARQVVSSATIPDKYISAPTFTVTATASSGLSVVLTGNSKVTKNSPTTFTPLALGQAVITAIQAGNSNYLADTLLLTFNIRSVPTTGLTDILDGRLIYSGYWKVGSGESSYWLYNLLWPSIGGPYTASRFLLYSGRDALGNVVKGNIVDNFKAWRWTGVAWEMFLEKTNNLNASFDTTLANVVISDKIYITSTRDIRNAAILDTVKVFGVDYTPPTGNEFTFALSGSARTSAAIYAADSTLVRTLWSGATNTAGSHTYTWDGLKDDGTSAPSGNYRAKVLSNNVTYTWEGIIGNTSYGQTYANLHTGLNPINSMVQTTDRLHIALGYSEGKTTTYYMAKTAPQAKFAVLPDINVGPAKVEYQATDGTNVYMASQDPYQTNYTYVFAYKVVDNTIRTFSSGASINLTYGNDIASAAGISMLNTANSRISGIAVQQSGNYLFVARKDLNQLQVRNKTTGALAQTLTYTSPRAISVDPVSGELWMVTSTATLTKYTVNVDGTLTSAGVTISGLSDPVATAVSADGATLLVADSGTSQQVKGFSTSSGSSSWTLGTSGGYSTDATASNTKFHFKSLLGSIPGNPSLIQPVYLCPLSDGGFWLGDGGNFRNLHFDASRSYVEQIMYIPALYTTAICQNAPTRVFAGLLEFEVDYGVTLSATTGWMLKANWGGGMTSSQYDFLTGIRSPAVLSNSRTYALVNYNGSKNPYQIVELVSGGVIRATGVFATASDYAKLYPDGSIRRMTYNSGGQQWMKKALSGFDGSFNPTYSSETQLQNTSTIEIKNGGTFYNPGEVTSSGVYAAFEGTKETGYHMAGVIGNAYRFKTSKANSTSYSGDFPSDGTYDIGNAITTNSGGGPGSVALAFENSILWQYYGEFWTGAGGQVNKYNHYSDKGLFIGQFGQVQKANIGGQSKIGMAGNGFSPSIAKVGSDYFIIHNDEGYWGGAHRWKITGLNTISEQNFTLTNP